MLESHKSGPWVFFKLYIYAVLYGRHWAMGLFNKLKLIKQKFNSLIALGISRAQKPQWLMVLGNTEIEYFRHSNTQCCSIPSPDDCLYAHVLSIIYLQKNLHIYTLVKTSFLSKRPTWPNTSLIFSTWISFQSPKCPRPDFSSSSQN